MARLVFTHHLQNHVHCPPMDADGATLGEVLAAAFHDNTRAQAYVLDEQGSIRKHIAIFIDGVPVQDRHALTDPVSPASRIDVIQALSGG